MKKISALSLGSVMAFMMLFGVVSIAPIAMAGPDEVIAKPDATCDTKTINIVEGVDCGKGKDTQTSLFEEDAQGNSLFKTVTNVLLFLIGAVSVIMLIVGGFRYVVSGGDSTQVTSAKNTIFYAVIGIIVALLAYAIVNFVVSSFIA